MIFFIIDSLLELLMRNCVFNFQIINVEEIQFVSTYLIQILFENFSRLSFFLKLISVNFHVFYYFLSICL